jgi:hypothetical protein
MAQYADSEHFRIHYDITGAHAPPLTDSDNNDIPDYVDSALVYYEIAYNRLLNLGFGTPNSDGALGGSEHIDCYMRELKNENVYGYTTPDRAMLITSSYITIDNNYSAAEGFYTHTYDALKITTAHELFHVIHFSYYAGADARWWMEQTAVWFEEDVWPDIDDYIHYLGYIFSNRDMPINSEKNNFMYSASVFAIYAAENYGPDSIQDSFAAFRDNRSGDIINLNKAYDAGVPDMLSNLGVWMYFTGNRANTADYFPDADNISYEVQPSSSHTGEYVTGTLTLNHYTFKYVELTPPGGFDDEAYLHTYFRYDNGGKWNNRVILYNSPIDTEIIELNDVETYVEIHRPYTSAIMVLSNASSDSGAYGVSYVVDDNPPPPKLTLSQNYPNPFIGRTTIHYTAIPGNRVKLKLYNIAGQQVSTLVDEIASGQENELYVVSKNLAAGVYFLVLSSNGQRETRKIVCLGQSK